MTVIQTTDSEFMEFVAKAYKDGYVQALNDTKQKHNINDDIIGEKKALELLKCGKSKLAKLRSMRVIVFYTNSRPFSYSKKSIMKYLENKMIN